MLTIGQVAKKYSLSRSTLIYYDKLGVLRPSGRSASNYRLYSPDDLKKMERIRLYRSAGLSLEAIESLLDQENSDLNSVLENRLLTINGELQGLRHQQSVILKILENESLQRSARVLSKEIWVSILRAAGLDDDGMRNWHIQFEKTSPEAHQDFLESLGIGEQESQVIRGWTA